MTDVTDEDREGIEQLYCFLGSERVCGADCMGFITFPKRSESSELSELQSHCGLLQNIDRAGRNLVILAGTLVSNSKASKRDKQDAAREAGMGTPATPYSGSSS